MRKKGTSREEFERKYGLASKNENKPIFNEYTVRATQREPNEIITGKTTAYENFVNKYGSVSRNLEIPGTDSAAKPEQHKATRESFQKKYGPYPKMESGRSGSLMQTAKQYSEDIRKTDSGNNTVNKNQMAKKSLVSDEMMEMTERYIKEVLNPESGYMFYDIEQKSDSRSTAERAKEYAEKYAADILNQTPKYPGTVLKPMTSDVQNALAAGRDQAIETGKRTPSLLTSLSREGYNNEMVNKALGYDVRYLTDEERADYYRTLERDGERAANRRLDALSGVLKQRQYEDEAERVKERSEEHPLYGLAANFAASVLSGAGFVEDVGNYIGGKARDPYSFGHLASTREQASREGLKAAARENIADSAVTDFLVDTGLSMGQSAARLPLGMAGTVVAGLGAATGAVDRAYERGASNEQALLSGATQGLAEGFFEKFSIGGLQAMKNVPEYSLRDFAKNMIKQAATEAGEEMFTEATNTATDRLIMQEDSEFELARENYLNQGMTEADATKKAYGDTIKNIALAGLGGALSGGIMGGGVLGYNAVNQKRAGMQSTLTGQDLQEIADAVDTDRSSYQTDETHQSAVNLQQTAQEYADAVKRGENLTDMQKGGIERDINEFTRAAAKEQQKMEQTKKAKTLEQEAAAEFARQATGSREEEMKDQPNVQPVFDQAEYDELAEYASNLGESGRKSFAESYDGNISIEEYQSAFGRYYDAGRYNIDLEAVDKSVLAALLSTEQATAAYKAGVQDRNRAAGLLDAKGRYITGQPKTGSAVDLTGRASDAQMKVADTIGKKTGLKFELVEKQDGVAGSYEKGTVRIAIDSRNFLQTTSHELTHFMKDYAPMDYEGYKSMAITALMDTDKVSYDDLVRQYESRYAETGTTPTREDVLDEIVADATGRFLNDEEFINNIARENRSIAQKIRDFLTDMVEAIKKLISDKGISRAANAMKGETEEALKMYEYARDAWAVALENAGEKYRSGEELQATGKRNAIEHPEQVSNDHVDRNYRSVRNMDPVIELTGSEFARGEKKLGDQVLEFFEKEGGKAHNDVIGDVLLDRRALKDDIAHGIGRKKAVAFAAVPEVIRKGYVLDVHENWKERGYDSAILGAKVKIADEDHFELVVVKVMDDKNRLYLHEIYTVKMGENPVQDQNRNLKTRGNADAIGGYSLPSIYSIFDRLQNVNEAKYQIEGHEIEDTDDKNLVAIHNLTQNKLKKMMEYEGIPMPSIAITKADIGHENFGDISLVFRKDTIDPKRNKKNKVYSADAWTPTFPRIEYEVDIKRGREIENRIRQTNGKIPEEYYRDAWEQIGGIEYTINNIGGEDRLISKVLENHGMKAVYLAEQGEEVELETTETRTTITEDQKQVYESILSELGDDIRTKPQSQIMEQLKRVWKEALLKVNPDADTESIDKASRLRLSGILRRVIEYSENGGEKVEVRPDINATNRQIDQKIDESKYENWVRELLRGIVVDKGFHNGKDRWTASGKERSFRQTHLAVTAENAVKAMIAQADGDVKNSEGFYGFKSLRGAASKDFGSIGEIKEASDRLRTIDNEEYENMVNELNAGLYSAMRKIIDKSGKGNSTEADEYLGQALMEIADKKVSDSNIRNTLERYGWRFDDRIVTELESIMRAARDIPVNMFEAKPQRVVDYSEIAAAVMPEDTDQSLLNLLEERGVRVVFYDPDEKNGRKKAINSLSDVRFQMEDTEQDVSAESIMSGDEDLQEANRILEEQINETRKFVTPQERDIARIAEGLLNEYKSTYPQDRLERNLTKLYAYIKGAEKVNMYDVTETATSLGKTILRRAQTESTQDKEHAKNVLSHIRATRIEIPESIRKDGFELYDGYQNFRKRYYKKLTLVNKGKGGIDVEQAYAKFQEQFPELFTDEIINPTDKALRIAEVVDELQPQIRNRYNADTDELAYLVGQKILESYFDVTKAPVTDQERIAAKAREAKRQYNERMRHYTERIKSESDALRREVNLRTQKEKEKLMAEYNDTLPRVERAALYKRMEELTSEKHRELVAQRERHKQVMKTRRENQEAVKHKQRIMKDMLEMQSWMVNPTDKKHVPERLRVPLAELLQEIDFSSERKTKEGGDVERTLKWGNLQRVMQEIAETGLAKDDGGMEIYMEVDPDIAAKMEVLKRTVADLKDLDKLDKLDIKKLRALREVVQSMKRSIADANALYENKRFRKIEEGALSFMKEADARKPKTEAAGTLGMADDMLNYDMLDPYTMFHKMGPTAETFYDELRDAHDKMVRNKAIAQNYITDRMKDLKVSPKDIRKWSGKHADTQTFEVDGGTLKLTPAQVMSLYVLNKRAQARGHLYHRNGGIRPTPVLKKKKGVWVEERTFDPVRITAEDTARITETLTEQQKKLADSIVSFFTTQTSEWGNEVSMKLYGYRKFMARNYFPIVSDSNYLTTKNSDLERNMSTLHNMGSTKSTQPMANNPIILEDIFDVYIRQSDQMANYNAFVVPLADLQKLYNYKRVGERSVKLSIERAFGKDAKRYLEELMRDANGATATRKEDVWSLMTRNMKAAAVGANMRTVVQQPTAYVRAAAEINPIYLTTHLMPSKAEWEKAKNYAPIIQWKEWGGVGINSQRATREVMFGAENLRNTVIEGSMYLAGKMDEVTWKGLWMSVRAETKAKYKELEVDSEEFYKQVAKRFNEIIDRTQVVDSFLNKSPIMKNKDGAAQMTTSFMSEPNKTYNMIYRAASDAGLKREHGTTKLIYTTVVYGLSGLATALAAGLIDAMRDDEDEVFKEKYMAAVADNFVSNILPTNILPVVKDIWSIFQGYEARRPDMQNIQKLYYAMQKMNKYIQGESSMTFPAVTGNLMKELAGLFGIPAGNLARDFDAAINTYLRCYGDVEATYNYERNWHQFDAKGNTGLYVGLAMKALYEGDVETGTMILKDMEEAGIDEDTIESKYKSILGSNPTIFEAAVEKTCGDFSGYKNMVEGLEEDSFVRDYVIQSINTMSKKLMKAAVAKKFDDPETYDKVVEDLIEDGHSEETIEEAVARIPDKLIMQTTETESDEPESLYTYTDLATAASISKSEFKVVLKEIIREKKAQGKDIKEIRKSIKSSFTGRYKKAYQNGKSSERQEIQRIIRMLVIDGEPLYPDDIFKEWMEDK